MGVPGLNRPLVTGTRAGRLAISQGAAWGDFDGSNFTRIGGFATPAATSVLSTLAVTNTHAANTLRVRFMTGVGAAAGDGSLIQAGDTVAFDLYGMNVTTISIYGSGAATTGDATGFFVEP